MRSRGVSSLVAMSIVIVIFAVFAAIYYLTTLDNSAGTTNSNITSEQLLEEDAMTNNESNMTDINLETQIQTSDKVPRSTSRIESERPNFDEGSFSYEVARASNRPSFCTYSSQGLFGETYTGEINVIGHDFVVKDDLDFVTARQGEWMYRWDFPDGSDISRKINLTNINKALSEYTGREISTYRGDAFFFANPLYFDSVTCSHVESAPVTLPPIDFEDRTEYWIEELIKEYEPQELIEDFEL
jgi:hypothetical protein